MILSCTELFIIIIFSALRVFLFYPKSSFVFLRVSNLMEDERYVTYIRFCELMVMKAIFQLDMLPTFFIRAHK